LNAHYTSAEVVQAAWRAVGELGFAGGTVLEPGCGSGNFLGFAPAGARLVGVELDPVTATVARHLYGTRAEIRTGRFEDFAAPDASFDLAIGNVPFAKVTPHDVRHNRGRHALHNYFLLKALHLVRPGGLVALLTSRYTLDARNPGARRELAALADLVGAVRLPAGAFWQSSGTEVVCDLVVLRRRGASEEPNGPAWARSVPAPFDDDAEPVMLNEYFLANPEGVVGRLGLARGMYRQRELTVEADGPLAEGLARALAAMVDDARRRSTTYQPRSHPVGDDKEAVGAGAGAVALGQQGSFVVIPSGGVARVQGSAAVAYQPRVAGDAHELARLIGLRDAASAVLAVQLAEGSDEDLSVAQGLLSSRYADYRRLYGPLNRYRLVRTGRVDPETGEDQLRRVRPRMGGFREDPDWPVVAALEVFDDETQHAAPAAIFTTRVISRPPERLGVDTGAEALAVCLDETGTVGLERVAELLGVDLDTARQELDGLVWEDPDSGELVPAARYLSGNIRHKLELARAAAATEARFEANVAALEAVLPRQLEPAEITAQLGAPWIPAADVERFCAEALGAEVDVEHLPAVARWSVALRVGRRASVALSSEWGTSRADAITLLDASLNQRLHTVTDETEEGRRVRNDAETIAAREKQEALGERFSRWLWEEPGRAERLARRYNELFSSVVLPAHDGSHLSLPGLAATFTPRTHQRDAVARILTDGRALLAHAVGAGKTATMVMAAMELRRLGLAAKPSVVVPNHMLDQFAREWLQLYPTARVLIAERHRLSRQHRKEFVARCATGDWDGVLFTQSGFGRLPLGRDLQAAYLDDELGRARQALAESRQGKRLTVKRLERRIAQLEETYQRLLAAEAKDDGVRFEETGIDYLFCDEAHLYKNRRVDSAIDGVGQTGSQRAQDLDAKLWALRRRHGERVVTFATATPVANSMAELWVMQRYLQPDVLAAADLDAFDAWAATFGRTVSALELAPDGASYRMHTRFARFQNVPELITMYRQVADVRTAEDLDLPVPALAGGKPETVVVPAVDRLRRYVEELAERAERVRNRAVEPVEDNMLKITGDGRRAALDLRLVGEAPDPDGGKLRLAVDRIAAIHRQTAERTYPSATDEFSLRPGALQLVFCDVSTPAGSGWNAYDELRSLLAERGVPAHVVRFIHEASTDEAKAKLFAACRDGRVAVLVGSTDKLGVGTNVQARAVALHHLDCPWRPADIEQRDGRILRQGNQNTEVEIFRYVSEASFDIYMWQTVERKAAFIAQVSQGGMPDREVDEIGEQALSYAEVKALANGNPLIMEKAGIDAEVAKLTRLERAHQDDQHRLRLALEAAERRAEGAERRAELIRSALVGRVDTKGERFAMTVDGQRYEKRADAGRHLRRVLAGLLAETPDQTRGECRSVGELAGLPVVASADRSAAPEVHVSMEEAGIRLFVTGEELRQADPVALVQRLERRIHNLDDALVESEQEEATASGEAERARSRLGRPFEHHSRLHRLRRRQHEISGALTSESGLVSCTDSAFTASEAASQRHPDFLNRFDARCHSYPAVPSFERGLLQGD
ncbi:MAG: methyltransferase domain-containing protein, partial [Actinomycetota bacterium]|nr:methyltransferase domain-containing protein [Actinomycetota bacterium]